VVSVLKPQPTDDFRWPVTGLLLSPFVCVCLFCRRNNDAEDSMLLLWALGATYLCACQLRNVVFCRKYYICIWYGNQWTLSRPEKPRTFKVSHLSITEGIRKYICSHRRGFQFFILKFNIWQSGNYFGFDGCSCPKILHVCSLKHNVVSVNTKHAQTEYNTLFVSLVLLQQHSFFICTCSLPLMFSDIRPKLSQYRK